MTTTARRPCGRCGQAITTPRMRRYCSARCRRAGRREQVRRNVAAYRARRHHEPIKRKSGGQQRAEPDYMSLSPDQLPPEVPEWRKRAACIGLTDLYYAEKATARSVQATADSLCVEECPVFGSCLRWSLTQSCGTYGRSATTSPANRREYRRRWNIRPPEKTSVEGAVNGWIDALRRSREQAASRARAVRG